ncbi:alpha/beta hydrolase [Dictyobacter alpinus]|uniref:Alpha/beta hydrolase n=1 Tax=Dictyobacter alpinus TaxID=2014873 RepID=A0A402BBU2_9CHLR|nr:dienelactone hydrolase family protein [Dictyobacter alpinus]GCE28786.1 alpha/beta hydrolase [Dictyobacter alpinus]
MSNMTYQDLNEQFFKLHGAKEYEQAVTLLAGKEQQFPEHARDIYYNRLCVEALASKQSEALQTLKQALEQGYWYAPEWLQKDADLVSLRELPEFKEAIKICEQHLETAQFMARPELVVLPAGTTETRYPLLVAMHGNNGNAANNSEPWTGVAEHGWLVALPQSSQIVGQDAYIWDDRMKSTHEIQAHLETLWQKHSLDPRRVVLGGFSMGGGQAVWMALHKSVLTLGFVALAPYLTKDELDALPALLAEHQTPHIRGYIIVSERDQECLPIAHQIADIMHNANLPCELEIIPDLGHSYPKDFSERVIKALAFVEPQ